MVDIYFEPQDAGLEKIAEIDVSDREYVYDIIGVWAADGELYMATDDGCSCPIPFENFAGKDDLTGPLTVDQVLTESVSLRDLAIDYHEHDDKTIARIFEDWKVFEEAVRSFNH